jgi:hypothetical protein
MSLQSDLERACSRGEGSRGPLDLTGSTSLQNRLYARQRQASGPPLADPGCEVLPTPPPPPRDPRRGQREATAPEYRAGEPGAKSMRCIQVGAAAAVIIGLSRLQRNS